MRAELAKVFGDDLQFEVEEPPELPDLDLVITLAVLLAVSMLGLIVAVALIIR